MYYLQAFDTRTEARVAVIDYIESYYNRSRPHSTVDYRIPAELMDEFFERTSGCQEMPLAA